MLALSRRLPTVRGMHTTHLWQLWPGRHWPLLREEEQEFRTELCRLAEGEVLEHDRGDYTAVLNALRCGLSAAELTEIAPGLRPGRLLGAYEHLEALRSESHAAWDALVEDPSRIVLARHSHNAARLLPVPVYRILSGDQITEGRSLVSVVAAASSEVARLRSEGAAVEDALRSLTPPSERAVTLGRELYDPYDPGVWGNPYFLPDRVGALMPVRVADLLGERRR